MSCVVEIEQGLLVLRLNGTIMLIFLRVEVDFLMVKPSYNSTHRTVKNDWAAILISSTPVIGKHL